MLSLEELQAQIANTASNDPTLASLYSRLAAQYKRRIDRGNSSDPFQDRERAIAAFNLARQNDRHQDEALILSGLSASAYNGNQLEEAIAYGQQAVDLARQFQNSLDEYGALYVLTYACNQNGQAERAIAYCQQAIEAARQAKTPSLEAHAWMRLGCLYEKGRNTAAAIQSFLSAQ